MIYLFFSCFSFDFIEELLICHSFQNEVLVNYNGIIIITMIFSHFFSITNNFCFLFLFYLFWSRPMEEDVSPFNCHACLAICLYEAWTLKLLCSLYFCAGKCFSLVLYIWLIICSWKLNLYYVMITSNLFDKLDVLLPISKMLIYYILKL